MVFLNNENFYIEILEEDLDPSITYELYKENEKIDLKDNKTDEEDDIENLFQSTLKNKKGG